MHFTVKPHAILVSVIQRLALRQTGINLIKGFFFFTLDCSRAQRIESWCFHIWVIHMILIHSHHIQDILSLPTCPIVLHHSTMTILAQTSFNISGQKAHSVASQQNTGEAWTFECWDFYTGLKSVSLTKSSSPSENIIRLSSITDCTVPLCCTAFGLPVFSMKATTQWNSPPGDIQSCHYK